MARQVDVKALVSHIVRGDGLDKCRICMGDTSQGQVHLGDTVMMDGDKAVTLSELLQVITGVEMVSEDDLPQSTCQACYKSLTDAANFRSLVHKAKKTWNELLDFIDLIPNSISQNTVKIYAEVTKNKIHVTEIKTVKKRIKKVKKGPFRCPKCDMECATARRLYVHLNQSADMMRACPVCAKIMDRNELLVHVSTHNKNMYSCTKCPALFLYQKPYEKHKLAHKPGGLTCGDCGKSLPSESALRAHSSIHSQRSCPNCKTQFNNQLCYVHHLQTCCDLVPAKEKSKVIVTLDNKEKLKMGARGSRKEKCICDYCKKTFAGRKFVAAHIKIVHSKLSHMPCPHCGKLFASARMPTHMKSHIKKSFECKICGITVISKLGYNQHLRLHTGEKPFACQYCGERFSASSRRSEHVKIMHEKSKIVLKQVCKECPAKFRYPFQLKLHLKKVHEQERKKNVYECNQCKKRFASCRSLLFHSKSHGTGKNKNILKKK